MYCLSCYARIELERHEDGSIGAHSVEGELLEEHRRILVEARYAYRKKQYEEVENSCVQVLSDDPLNAGAYLLRILAGIHICIRDFGYVPQFRKNEFLNYHAKYSEYSGDTRTFRSLLEDNHLVYDVSFTVNLVISSRKKLAREIVEEALPKVYESLGSEEPYEGMTQDYADVFHYLAAYPSVTSEILVKNRWLCSRAILNRIEKINPYYVREGTMGDLNVDFKAINMLLMYMPDIGELVGNRYEYNRRDLDTFRLNARHKEGELYPGKNKRGTEEYDRYLFCREQLKKAYVVLEMMVLGSEEMRQSVEKEVPELAWDYR